MRTACYNINMENLPKDPAILLSCLNMMLRDEYDGLDSLCDDLGLDRAFIEAQMRKAGYVYAAARNQFILL